MSLSRSTLTSSVRPSKVVAQLIDVVDHASADLHKRSSPHHQSPAVPHHRVASPTTKAKSSTQGIERPIIACISGGNVSAPRISRTFSSRLTGSVIASPNSCAFLHRKESLHHRLQTPIIKNQQATAANRSITTATFSFQPFSSLLILSGLIFRRGGAHNGRATPEPDLPDLPFGL